MTTIRPDPSGTSSIQSGRSNERFGKAGFSSIAGKASAAELLNVSSINMTGPPRFPLNKNREII
jgi:hypothetical protein